MTKLVSAAALAAALMAGSAIPAFADVVSGAGTSKSPAKLSQYGASGSLAFPTTGLARFPKGSFTYNYFFQVDSAASLSGITASASSTTGFKVPGTTTVVQVPNVNFTSFQIVNLFTTPVAGTNPSYYPGLTGNSYTLAANTTYELIVKGDVSNGTGSFNGNLSVVSAVPLPTSVAMFGTALLGLGAFGAIRRKKVMASATA